MCHGASRIAQVGSKEQSLQQEGQGACLCVVGRTPLFPPDVPVLLLFPLPQEVRIQIQTFMIPHPTASGACQSSSA